MITVIKNGALVLIISYVLQLFLPWWIVLLVALAVASGLAENTMQAFSCASIGIGLLTLILSLNGWIPEDHLLFNSMNQWFNKPTLTSILTALIMSLLSGIFAIIGYYIGYIGRKKYTCRAM